MDNKQNNEAFPDISGVFDINENDIPAQVILPEAKSSERPKDYEPILLSDPEQKKQDSKERKKLKAQKKEEKLAEKRKLLKKRLIICAVFVIAVFGAVFGIKSAVDYSRRPTGEIVNSYTGSIYAHYDTKALLTTDVTEQGKVRTVAVFSENDFDNYSLSTGLTANITVDETVTATGKVVSFSKETSDSSLMEKIRKAFPDGEYSSGINWIITVETDFDANIQDGIIADISIITKISDNAVLVPSSAVHKIGARFYVWTYKPLTHTALKQEVSVGIVSDGITEITKDLKPDTRIVASFSCEDNVLTDTVKLKSPKEEK